MRTICVELPHASYPILVGDSLLGTKDGLEALAAAVAGRRCMVVTDDNVEGLHGAAVQAALAAAGAEPPLQQVFPAGEPSKTLATVERLYHSGIAAGLDRNSSVIAAGGGVVGDVAGFFAATFLRGIACVQVPTTLLAMVDSSVGGKVGVDLPEGKNLVGAFHQPRLVLADLAFLTTLPAREIRCGLAEVVKYGIIMDAALFSLLEKATARINQLDVQLYERVVSTCCTLKAQVVQEDEKESGRRAILNYGHTFGHALEAMGDFSTLQHGEAVAIGMGMAADLAVALKMVSADLPARQDALLQHLGLPLCAEHMHDTRAEAVLDVMHRDKKARGGRLRLVLPRAIGAVEVVECARKDLVLQAIGGRIGQS